MSQLVEVAFRGNRKEFYLWESPDLLPPNTPIIVEADRGEDLGHVHATGELAEKRAVGCAHGCASSPPSKKALRLATKRDVRQNQSLTAANEDARRRAMEKVHAAELQMKISDAEWQWDRKKLTLYFTADKRVDFRNLVRELATTFRTRIELKQIGVRDEAKRLDGIGRCGRQYCSASWLPELRPVNLGVAKDQRLSLNPSQISGACGRLMCCLRYEHEFYVQTRKRFPKEGRVVVTTVGEEKVLSVDLFRESVTLRTAEGVTRTVPLAQYTTEVTDRPPVLAPLEDEHDPADEISPELMYTSEFAIPEPRLVILTESIEPEPPPRSASHPPSERRSTDRRSSEGSTRRRRGRRGGRRDGDQNSNGSNNNNPENSGPGNSGPDASD